MTPMKVSNACTGLLIYVDIVQCIIYGSEKVQNNEKGNTLSDLPLFFFFSFK